MSIKSQTQIIAPFQSYTISGHAGLLQRKCACGQHTVVDGACEDCRQKREGMILRAAVSSAPVNSVPPIVNDVLSSPGQPLDTATCAFMESRFGNDFSQIQMHTKVPEIAHTRLSINQPGDQYEQEADRIADAAIGLPQAHEGTVGSEQPRFRHDFSQVRVHTDTQAAESAQAVNAQAYTIGSDIVFGAGQYMPETGAGKRLLAHELTHVIQQRGSKASQHAQKQAAFFMQRSPGTREDLQKTYKITIEKGNKDRSPSDIKDLELALSTLQPEEAQVLKSYRFIRWSTKEDRKAVDESYEDQGEEECSLHEPNLETKTFKISMYNKCFKDPEATSQTMAGISIGQFNILHEIGHAMQIAELRKSQEVYDAAVDKYNIIIQSRHSESKIDELDKAVERAKKKRDEAKDRTINEFNKLIEDKAPLTEYSKTSPEEAFAEAFAIYKADPKGIKKNNPELYNWFSKYGELNPLKKGEKERSKKGDRTP